MPNPKGCSRARPVFTSKATETKTAYRIGVVRLELPCPKGSPPTLKYLGQPPKLGVIKKNIRIFHWIFQGIFP